MDGWLERHPVAHCGKVGPAARVMTKAARNASEDLSLLRQQAVDVRVLEADTTRGEALGPVRLERLIALVGPPERDQLTAHA